MTGLSSQEQLFKYQQDLLTKEIEHIHFEIDHFDTLSFQIKGWSITIWAALVAFGVKEQAPLIVLASLPAMLTFWILDANFKRYQRQHSSRKSFIQKFMDSDGYFKERGLREAFEHADFGSFPIHDPVASRTRKIDGQFEHEFEKRTSFWRAFTTSNIIYFYLLLMLSTGILVIVL